MMTLAEMADLVCEKVNKTDLDSVALCKRFLKRRYQLIYNQHLWKDSLDLAEITNDDTETNIAIMPQWMERVIAVREGEANTLTVEEQSLFFKRDASFLDRVGSLSAFHQIKPYFWPVILSGADSITITCEDEDAGKSLFFRDRSGVFDVVEFEAGLDEENSPVVDLNGYDLENLRVTKEVTSGIVGLAKGPTLVKFGPAETQLRFERIKLLEDPDESVDLLVLGKRRADLLENDGDASQIQNIDDALIAHAQADMLERDRQYGKADTKRKEANAQVKIAIDLETNQSARICLITPVSYHNITNGDDL